MIMWWGTAEACNLHYEYYSLLFRHSELNWMRQHVRRNSITQDDTVSLFLITPVPTCSLNFHFGLGFAVIGPNSGKVFFLNKTNHKTWGWTRAMPIAKPVCVAHWRAEIRLFNCTFCNLPSHCLISSYEKPGCWYVILQKGKINISSTKTTDALFSKDWSVVSCSTAIIWVKELWLPQPQWNMKR